MDEVVWIEVFWCCWKYWNSVRWSEMVCYSGVGGKNYVVKGVREWV